MTWLRRSFAALKTRLTRARTAARKHADDLLIVVGIAFFTAGCWIIHPAAALLFLGLAFGAVGMVVGGRMAAARAPDSDEEED